MIEPSKMRNMTRRATQRLTASKSGRGALRARSTTKVLSSTRDSAARDKFERLARKWRRETAALSSTIDIVMHPSYQSIIGMGDVAVPLMLESLTHRLDHWFWALEAITQENPVPRRVRGNLEEMARAWLKWGHQRGLVAFDAKATAA